MQETQEAQVRSLGQEDPLEKGMATQPSILAGRIQWLEEPGGLQSMGLQRVGHNWSNLALMVLDLDVIEKKSQNMEVRTWTEAMAPEIELKEHI